MRLRYTMAPLLLASIRLARAMSPAEPMYRIALLHGVKPSEVAALRQLVQDAAADGSLLDPVAVEELHVRDRPAANGSHRPLEGLLLTFDDGFRSNFAMATEVLEPLGARAVFFVCPGLIELGEGDQAKAVIDNVLGGVYEPAGDEGAPRLMDWAQLRALRDRGHVIGCHGMHHRRLSSLPSSQLHEEIIGAADLLAERMGERTFWYAYAFGDIDSVSAEALSIIATGFPICRSGVRGPNQPTTPGLALRADHIDLTAPTIYRRLAIEGGLDFQYRAARARLDAMMRQTASGIDDIDQS